MAENKEKDVKEESSPPAKEPEKKDVEPTESDSEINFASLRKKNEDLVDENEELREKLGAKDETDRSLGTEGDESDEEGAGDAGDKDEPDKPEADDTLKLIFDREVKDVVQQWNIKHKDVTSALWAKIKAKVILKGTETKTEISQKIDEAYQNLPEVREKRDQKLRDEGRKEAMSESTDEELDTGGGGDVDTGEKPQSKLNPKSKKWAKGLGLTDKEATEVDQDEDPSEWKEGPDVTRAPFQG